MNRLSSPKEQKLRKRPARKADKKTVLAFSLTGVVMVIALLLILFHPIFITSSENTARELAESYFEKQMTLSDFDVTDSAIVMYNNENFVQVKYNVKPNPSAYKSWRASGGQDSENGWITEKIAFIRYYKIGFIYITGFTAYRTI